jgi:hypothetical protein
MVPTLKSSKKFHCETCHYFTSRKSQYDRHIATDKHKILQNPTHEKFQNVKLYNCECGKIYKHSSTLYAHKKTCFHINNNNTFDYQNVSDLTDKEIIKTLLKIVENGNNTNNTTNNTTNNNNSHNTTNIDNKTFNLNFFLNETCKDAMNISEFVSSIKVSLTDLENTGRQGYIEGISNIILHLLTFQTPIIYRQVIL